MIHIVFQEPDIAVLQKAIELDEKLAGDIIQIKDDFAVGPIINIYETEGYQQRRDWWKMLLEFSPYTEQLDIVDDKMTVHKLKDALDVDDTQYAWIWMGQNQHDVCGYYWLMNQLKDYQGRIFVLYLNNLPFINEKGGIFYPTALHEILPKEFLKAKKLARPITLSEFEVDPDEWKKLCNENGMVRLLEGGKKLVSKEVTYYDKDVLNAVTAEPQKLQKIFSNLFSKQKIKTGDVFLAWRMREMIKAGTLEVQGDWVKGWKEISIKLAGATVASDEMIETPNQ
ncbi:MAG TPA: DUF1835 domain-containing protein [Panacibacter sp.]|nr:DUF1835 domain-containing protein [Panacibacter sp.]